jgi:CubicO group peptidase (beta-lactamase class C family)
MISAFCSLYNFCRHQKLLCLSFSTTLFLSLFCVSACHSSTSLPSKTRLKDTLIMLPAASSLSAADSARYNHASEIWYDTFLKRSGFNGGMVVAKNGHIIFEKYAGTAHLRGTDSITAETPMHIASISKTFTAMCILKLCQDKKLGLDDEYSKYFPQFNYPGVTIRTLLDHRSGLPNYLYFMDELGWNKKAFMKNQDVFDYLVNKKSELKNITKPNTHFTYCNTNFALLALLAEKVSGTSFPQLMKRTFFDPLQMKHTYIFLHSDSATATPSYDWRGRQIAMDALDDVYGDKNVYTTPEDLLTWDKALKSNLIFTKETLEQAYTGYSNEKKGVKNYGLGWRMNNYPNGKKLIYHNGWWHGSNAAFVRLLDEDATIIIIGNKYNRNIYKAKDLSNIFSNYFETDSDEDVESSKDTQPIITAVIKKPMPKHQTKIREKKLSSSRKSH